MKSFRALLRLYLAQLWVHLSVVQMPSDQQQRTPRSKVNRTYQATFIAFGIGTIYGTLGLHLESGHPLTIDSLQASPFHLWRQFLPKQIWPQVDIIVVVVLLSQLVVLYNFAFKSIDWQHQFTIIKRNNKQPRVKLAGKALSQCESTRLLAVFRRARLIYTIFGFAIYPPALLYTEGMVFLFSKVYFVSFTSLTYWFIVWPFMLLIVVLFLFVNLIHIIVSGSGIQIRQQYHIGKFARVLARLTRRRPQVGRLERAWPVYRNFNRAVLSIGLQLEGFNAFYTNYLTVILLEYNVIQVLLTYVVFFGPSNSLAMLAVKPLFGVCIFEMAVLLFGLIQFCARVVKKNGHIGRLNRQFAIHCLQHRRLYRLRLGQLLKLELLQWPRLLHLYAFKIFGNSRITSKTFYVMAINISGFFLFVLKRMH